jgi:VanZ family protein
LAPFLVIAITFIYGGILEIAQENLFDNRSGDLKDLLSDLAGCLLATILYYVILRKYIKRYLSKFRT